jgi:hypothetical protein
MVDISMVSVLAEEICEIHSVLSSRVGGVDSQARTAVGRWEIFSFQQVLTTDTESTEVRQYRQNDFLKVGSWVE